VHALRVLRATSGIARAHLADARAGRAGPAVLEPAAFHKALNEGQPRRLQGVPRPHVRRLRCRHQARGSCASHRRHRAGSATAERFRLRSVRFDRRRLVIWGARRPDTSTSPMPNASARRSHRHGQRAGTKRPLAFGRRPGAVLSSIPLLPPPSFRDCDTDGGAPDADVRAREIVMGGQHGWAPAARALADHTARCCCSSGRAAGRAGHRKGVPQSKHTASCSVGAGQRTLERFCLPGSPTTSPRAARSWATDGRGARYLGGAVTCAARATCARSTQAARCFERTYAAPARGGQRAAPGTPGHPRPGDVGRRQPRGGREVEHDAATSTLAHSSSTDGARLAHARSARAPGSRRRGASRGVRRKLRDAPSTARAGPARRHLSRCSWLRRRAR